VGMFIVSFLEERTFIMSHIIRVSLILRLLKQMFKMGYSDKCTNVCLSSIIKLGDTGLSERSWAG
jgi:hypothetical protein